MDDDELVTRTPQIDQHGKVPGALCSVNFQLQVPGKPHSTGLRPFKLHQQRVGRQLRNRLLLYRCRARAWARRSLSMTAMQRRPRTPGDRFRRRASRARGRRAGALARRARAMATRPLHRPEVQQPVQASRCVGAKELHVCGQLANPSGKVPISSGLAPTAWERPSRRTPPSKSRPDRP